MATRKFIIRLKEHITNIKNSKPSLGLSNINQKQDIDIDSVKKEFKTIHFRLLFEILDNADHLLFSNYCDLFKLNSKINRSINKK